MAESVIECSEKCLNIAASQQLKAGLGKLLGIFVSGASASPTIKVWDSLTAANKVIVGTFTPLAGQFYPMPTNFSAGLFITISGTVDCTVFFE